ncbi:hypothetical protein G6F37_004273 [Rhizopus arrhizus]|nr:hypothetical protein G6F38_000143 [Rhizopus arrhizus]KAG1160134.1 hypothetical protein G6F37_004273 [Rhizopus arrhizus]
MGKSNQELKYKRLKVGHACYVCRSKKIKCDGLRPCMQCKARGRNCISSKTESLSKESSETSKDHLENNNSSSSCSSSSCSESDDDSILFSRPRKSFVNNSESTLPFCESRTSHTVTSIATSVKEKKEFPAEVSSKFPMFGNFVRWTTEPPLPTHYSHPIEMPAADVQMHMIDLFFQTYYETMPLIPKTLFYEQLHVKGPLITPLLLNAIYCTVSGFTTQTDVPKPSVFFNRAKKLVDDFLDTPRVSTVIALCLLSLYEPSPTRGKTSSGTQHCRAWIYGGMAFRMCLELGLNIDNPETRKMLGPQDIELRRRAFWTCYVFDKIQSQEWERAWILPSSLANVSLPTALSNDDANERQIIAAFAQTIKLFVIAEEGLQIRSLFAINGRNDTSVVHSQLELHYSRILNWKQELLNDTAFDSYKLLESTATEPYLVYSHLIFYYMLIETLILLPQTAERISKQRGYAAELIKHADIICLQPSKTVPYEMIVHTVGTSLRAYLDDDSKKTLMPSELISKCLKIFSIIQQRASIPKFSEIVRHVHSLYQHARKTQQTDLVEKRSKGPEQDPMDPIYSFSPSLEEKGQQEIIAQHSIENDFLSTNEYSCHTNNNRLRVQTEMQYQKQPWQDMVDKHELMTPSTPEDPLQQFSNSPVTDPIELTWPLPYLSQSAFSPDVNTLTCQEQPYLTQFSNLSPSSYMASPYAHPTPYLNESYHYLDTEYIDHFSTLSSIPTTAQQLYYIN